MKDNDMEQNEKEPQSEILWIEGDGIGYCLTEKDYNAREKEVKHHEKKTPKSKS